MIRSVKLRNYRSLEAVDVSLSPVSVFFGPNGSGKSSFLDSLSFVRDCVSGGIEEASAIRGNGMGLLYDAATDRKITIEIVTDELSYNVRFRVESGRLSAGPSEVLNRLSDGVGLLIRSFDLERAEVIDDDSGKSVSVSLRSKDDLAVSQLFFGDHTFVILSTFNLLTHIRSWHLRSLRLDELKQRGSSSGTEYILRPQGDNLWSVLRNIALKQHVDSRWDTILKFMREANPSFHNIVIDQLGPNVVYAQFLEKFRRGPTSASQVSDGYLQQAVRIKIWT